MITTVQPAPRVSRLSRRERAWIIAVGAIIVAFVAAGVIKALVDSQPQFGGQVVADTGDGIGYGIRDGSLWKCYPSVAFNCEGPAMQPVHVQAGAAAAKDITRAFGQDTTLVIRFDPTRWRCEAPAAANRIDCRAL